MFDELGDISEQFPQLDGFCYPDWFSLSKLVEEKLDKREWNDAWTHLGRRWLGILKDNLGKSYQCFETKNFLLLVDASRMVAVDISKFAEDTLSKIFDMLPTISNSERFGKHVLMVFSSQETYYEYTSHFYGDGDHPISSGVFLSGNGYAHFAFPFVEYLSYRAVIAHELTHACLAHLPLPLWLNEALAMRMEEIMHVGQLSELDEEKIEKHCNYWNPQTIQDFWSGKSWSNVGDGNELSYSLSLIIWRKIEVDLGSSREEIVSFVKGAGIEDAGEVAFQRIFQISLGDLVSDFLGDGQWSPKPQLS